MIGRILNGLAAIVGAGSLAQFPAFFQQYLEDSEDLLARDAYDEFARAPYEEVIDLKDRMDHAQLVAWIQDPDVSPRRRRLYLTMLGV